MKKIILGSLMTTFSPFIILLGSSLLHVFSVNEYAMNFACVMGAIAICFNFVIGCLLIIRGYQDQKTFQGWGM